jgi:two-component system, cell cycle sensor histidine kinase PleC
VPPNDSPENPIPAEKPPGPRRKSVGQRVREARDQLTSTTGTRATFDYELVRQFADNRVSASLMVLLLVFAVGFVSSFWTGAETAGIWTLAVLVIHVITISKCRQFLASARAGLNLRAWQMRFILVDLFYGLAWMFNLVTPVSTDERSNTFMLFIMLLVVAVSSMLSASLPIAAFAATMPVTFAVALNFAMRGTLQDYVLTAMALLAQVFFMLLIRRLYLSGVATLVARAEKDALIVELEEAKENADQARRRAESASVAKSQFLAQMSHELRTPLNAILGFSEVMKTEVFGVHAVPAYKEYSNDIHTSGQHLLNLINEVLDLSRIEAGRYELNEEAISLTSVVEECQHLLRLRAENRGIAIHQVFEPKLPRLWADERAIRQVCLNLMSNAVKFTPPGGEIWLKVGWTASGGQYMSVKDTGPGIPENEISIVLSKFGQGSNAIKSAEQGTGLGLPIAKNLIELHGGTFTLKSKVRIGTELIATFPPERVMSALAPITESSPPLAPQAETPDKSKHKRSLFRLRG